MSGFSVAASFLPLAVLLVVSLWRGVTTGIFSGLIVTVFLYFVFGHSGLAFVAVVFSAFVGTVNILMIIFGAVFLYYVMEQKGFISGIAQSLEGIHPDPGFRFFFLAFFLTAFFESVAGFGTPGAIVPLLLISMGYNAVLSISIVLLLDGLFAMTGAIGTPVTAGLEIPLRLTPEITGNVYLYSSIALLPGAFVIVAFVQRHFRKMTGQSGSISWIFMLLIMIPFAGLSRYARELTGLAAAVVMALLSFLLLFKDRNLKWKPWLPYWILIGLLLVPKIFPGFGSALGYRLTFDAILGTDVSASLQPFRSPLVPFLAAAAFAIYRVNDFTINLKPVMTRTVAVFVVLFPSLVITQLMLVGTGETPSMVETISSVFVSAGAFYPVLSPLIGVLGAFISGSTTVSNLIFGAAQHATAQTLHFDSAIVLALQLAGASLGNAICLFNIIAAAAVAGVKDYRAILTMNLQPVIIASVTCSLVGFMLIWVLK